MTANTAASRALQASPRNAAAHQSAALTLGVDSDCEYLDIHLTEMISAEEVRARLNAQLPEGLVIVEAWEVYDEAGMWRQLGVSSPA